MRCAVAPHGRHPARPLVRQERVALLVRHGDLAASALLLHVPASVRLLGTRHRPRTKLEQLLKFTSTIRGPMSIANATDVYYDPYDVGINADPYPVYERLREEAPIYHNE